MPTSWCSRNPSPAQRRSRSRSVRPSWQGRDRRHEPDVIRGGRPGDRHDELERGGARRAPARCQRDQGVQHLVRIEPGPGGHRRRPARRFVAGDDVVAKARFSSWSHRSAQPGGRGPLARPRWLEVLAFLNITLNMHTTGDWQSAWKLVGAPASVPASLPAAAWERENNGAQYGDADPRPPPQPRRAVRPRRSRPPFYARVFGFEVVGTEMGGQAVFMRAANGDNHHDLGLFSVGPDAPRPARGSVGLYHLAWEVPPSTTWPTPPGSCPRPAPSAALRTTASRSRSTVRTRRQRVRDHVARPARGLGRVRKARRGDAARPRGGARAGAPRARPGLTVSWPEARPQSSGRSLALPRLGSTNPRVSVRATQPQATRLELEDAARAGHPDEDQRRPGEPDRRQALAENQGPEEGRRERGQQQGRRRPRDGTGRTLAMTNRLAGAARADHDGQEGDSRSRVEECRDQRPGINGRGDARAAAGADQAGRRA